MREVWLVFRLCNPELPGDGRDLLGAFMREADAVGYGVWLLASDEFKGYKVQIMRAPVAPPGAMRPPEEEFASS